MARPNAGARLLPLLLGGILLVGSLEAKPRLKPAEKEPGAEVFQEMGKVLQHPRCINCHPSSARPLQGEDSHLHVPPVQRGKEGLGLVGMRCSTCHNSENFDPAGVPGHELWRLAPASMAWQGRDLSEICDQIKDPARNGGKTLAEVVHHMGHDPLVGWAWKPGKGRKTPPGTWAQFRELSEAWLRAGGGCP